MPTTAGILALGMYVPDEVRTNAWWPPGVVAGWAERRRHATVQRAPEPLTDGMRRVLRAIADHAADPFQGTVERRVLAADRSALDMEERAAREAIERAAIDPAAIDLVLTHTVVPDVQLANPACQLHHRLGLSAACLSMHVEATAYSVFGQLALAEAAIAAGRARYALLVQSCVATRLIDADDPSSVLVGDGATAIVLGPARAPRGVLATAHFTDGRYPRSLVMTVPGGRWFDDGRARMHVADPQELFEAQLHTADACAASVDAVLAAAALRRADIDVLCVYQGNSWIQGVVHDQLGVENSRPVDVFRRFGYLSSAMIPAALYLAQLEAKLRDDDIVAMTGGGTGQTYGATLVRWGS